LCGIIIFPVIISLLSIFAKLFKLKKKKYYLVRPLLTIICFMLIFATAQWTYKIALDQATTAARLIHAECNTNSFYPKIPDGWKSDGSRIIKRYSGLWLEYIASYTHKTEGFSIRVYQGPDLGETITAGINIPMTMERYREK
jgi:hypothetical protein